MQRKSYQLNIKQTYKISKLQPQKNKKKNIKKIRSANSYFKTQKKKIQKREKKIYIKHKM